MKYIPVSTGLGDIILCMSYCVENSIKSITFPSQNDCLIANTYLDYFNNPPVSFDNKVEFHQPYQFIPYTETTKLLKSKYRCLYSDKIFINLVVGNGPKAISEEDAKFLQNELGRPPLESSQSISYSSYSLTNYFAKHYKIEKYSKDYERNMENFAIEHKKKNDALIDSKLCITTEGGCAWHAHACGVPVIIIRKDDVFRQPHERLAHDLRAWCHNVREVLKYVK